MGVSNKPGAASAPKRQTTLTVERFELLQMAYAAADAARAARHHLDETITRGIAAGLSMAEVGRALGISKQAAHARYATATARRRPAARTADTLF